MLPSLCALSLKWGEADGETQSWLVLDELSGRGNVELPLALDRRRPPRPCSRSFCEPSSSAGLEYHMLNGALQLSDLCLDPWVSK